MESVLLLDKNFMAVSIVGWKKALNLMMREKVEPVNNNIIKVVSGRKCFSVPSIVRLKNPISYNCFSRRLVFSRKNVLLRDAFRCQYCFVKLSLAQGTIDHVLPSSRGGKTEYTNCVACCRKCNAKKGNMTPEEAGMKLLRLPRRPNSITLYSALENLPQEWVEFIGGLK